MSSDDLSVACQDCLNLILNTEKFALRCAKVVKMFCDLSNDQHSERNSYLLRQMYGLIDSEEFVTKVDEPDTKLNYNYLEIELINEHLKSEQEESGVDRTASVPNEEFDIEYLAGSDDDDCSDGQNDEETFLANQRYDRIEKLDESDDRGALNFPESPKKRTYNKKTTGFTCTLCDMKFTGPKWYEKHMQTRHSSGGPVEYACSKCPKRFPYRYCLKDHENIHLPDDLRMIYKCLQCEKKYKTSSSLKMHIKFVHTKERLYVCEECGKHFGDNASLKTHKIVHMQERPSKCTLCPKSFKDISHLKKHMEIHTEATNACPECGKMFNTKRSLRSHMSVHSDQKMYKCHLCKLAFKRRYGLKVNNYIFLFNGVSASFDRFVCLFFRRNIW